MAWKTYFLKYRLASPIHIGDLSLGNVQKTLFYIPGRTLWGAATAILTRANKASPVFQDYKTIGEDVLNAIRFGYFYLEHENKRYLPLWSHNGIRYGPDQISIDEMQHRFLFSEASTAIVNNTFAAETASLHETEYIWPQNRAFESKRKPLYFSGFLYLNLEKLVHLKFNIEAELIDHLRTLFIGANRKMGAGKLILKINEVPNDSETSIPDENNLIIKLKKSQFTAAHILYEDESKKYPIEGPVQPLVYRDWAEHKPPDKRFGAGQNVVYEGVGWVPGALLLSDISVQIVEYGRWKIV
ncbi:hypothetical protein JW964_27875 [candidate division KSB1 bacterium]|nr:hypothetical protein [candidate division KSB1 bacterium]